MCNSLLQASVDLDLDLDLCCGTKSDPKMRYSAAHTMLPTDPESISSRQCVPADVCGRHADTQRFRAYFRVPNGPILRQFELR